MMGNHFSLAHSNQQTSSCIELQVRENKSCTEHLHKHQTTVEEFSTTDGHLVSKLLYLHSYGNFQEDNGLLSFL